MPPGKGGKICRYSCFPYFVAKHPYPRCTAEAAGVQALVLFKKDPLTETNP